jgi:hypothetical protein
MATLMQAAIFALSRACVVYSVAYVAVVLICWLIIADKAVQLEHLCLIK